MASELANEAHSNKVVTRRSPAVSSGGVAGLNAKRKRRRRRRRKESRADPFQLLETSALGTAFLPYLRQRETPVLDTFLKRLRLDS